MRPAQAVNREAPARRGYRFLALAACAALTAWLALPGLTLTASAATGVPQSSSKSSGKSSSGKSSSKSSKKKKPQRHREPIQKAPTGDRIEEIQTALAREGYYHGDPSKKWDSATQDALRRFQEEHGMTGNGKLDATTLQKLGLGSDIAGVSAPKPVKGTAAPPPADVTPANSPSANADTDSGGI